MQERRCKTLDTRWKMQDARYKTVENHASGILHPASRSIYQTLIFLTLLILVLTSQVHAVPKMSEYCYLPPFVTDPNTPPNIMIAYEKGPNIMSRAYPDTYVSTEEYYGFFDPSINAKYRYDTTCDSNKGCFVRDDACTANAGNNYNCFPGRLLNWALMTSTDLSRKALVGFGWPHTGVSAGSVFTYTGNLISYSQWNGSTPRSVGGGYTFYIVQAGTGSNPSKLRVKWGEDPTWNGSCTGTTICPISGNNRYVAVQLPTPTSINDEAAISQRIGIIQKYADKNRDLVYDSDAPRFGIRRWDNGVAKQADILCDRTTALGGCGSPNCSSVDKSLLFSHILDVISQDPQDPTPYLGTMMGDIVKYFRDAGGNSFSDNKPFTQSSYSWCNDPAKNCRKTFALFITTGAYLGEDADRLTTTCSTDASLTTAFSQNTCYGFNTDLSTESGKQNILTYIVHTAFVTGATNTDNLKYAASVGGGEYIGVNDPAKLQSKIEEAILNILSTSASASTVATLTTQSRESSTLTQAYFYPKREGTPLRWVGYLRLLWSDTGANLREDTLNKGWLDLKNDKILSFFYDPAAVAYRARTYSILNASPYLTINTCNPNDGGNATKDNDYVEAIWNAQTKLQNTDPANRNIKIGVGDTAGVVTGSQMYDFLTTTTIGAQTLPTVLQPFWNPATTCVNNPARWCATNADCRFCNNNVNRSCPGGTDSECRNYCTSDTSVSCSVDGDCNKGSCSSMVCDNNVTQSCTASSECPTGGVCVGTCSGDPAKACVAGTGCVFGTCELIDTCNASDTCTPECDVDNCATQTIKFARGYDRPTNISSAVTAPGNKFRLRHETITTADNTNTLKLGDIVYSTPRISPNAPVNGYDITYKDSTYSNFVNSIIRGNCNDDDDCPGSETCSSGVCGGGSCTTDADCASGTCLSSGVCAGDGYTPIVLVGANDGMVHAFKVSKIKDISPAEDNCYGDGSCGGVANGYQTARFADRPRSAKSDTNPTGTDTAPPTDLGKEMWAYIPYNAVPYLRWYCEETYCHIPMVDARFTIIDASIDYDKSGTVDASDTDAKAVDPRCASYDTTCDCLPKVGGKCAYPWRRLLVGTMGVGGKQITVGSNTWSSSIFVLDITKSSDPKLLWERPLPDRTLTTSTPAIIRLSTKPAGGQPINDDENGRWYVVIGSGPERVETNTVTYKSTGANIYVFDLRNGNLVATLPLGASGVAVGDLLAVDLDSDYQVDAIYFGTYGGSGASQTGKLYRLRIRNGASYQTTPSHWDIETVVNVGRPIFASPEIALDAVGNIWLYFGTGIYLALEHASATTDNEYVYGVKETEVCWKGISGCASIGSTVTPSYSNFLDTTYLTFRNAQAVEAGCFCAGQKMSTISCDASGNCPGSCGDNKICSNNSSQTCATDADCPGAVVGSCIENKIVLSVTNARLVETSGGVTSCDGLRDKAAIDCLTAQINSSNGCGGSACNGWRRAFSGHKIYSKPFVTGGLVTLTSMQPTSTSCSLGGNAHLISLFYTTGTPYVQPTIYNYGGTSADTTDLTINASVNLGTGIPPLGESLVALPLAGDTYKVITQVSGGVTSVGGVKAIPVKSGYLLWIVK